MTLHVRLKTTRTKSGYANAEISRYLSPTTPQRIRYAFQFYNDFKAFNHHNDLRAYVLEKHNVDIGNKEQCWGL